jgi:hypothetical protein
MQFTKIGLEPDDCQCLNFEDKIEGIYARRIKFPDVADDDFITKYEKDKPAALLVKPENCSDWCHSQVSLSINEWIDNQQESIIRKYLQAFKKRKPNAIRKDAVLIFKLAGNLGRVKNTSNDKDISHCDLYKSDEFELLQLTIIRIIKLSDMEILPPSTPI